METLENLTENDYISLDIYDYTHGPSPLDHRILTKEEEHQLFQIYQSNCPEDKHKALQILIVCNQRMVFDTVKNFLIKIERTDLLDEFFQKANIWLIKSIIPNFDYTKNYRFSSYCIPCLDFLLIRNVFSEIRKEKKIVYFDLSNYVPKGGRAHSDDDLDRQREIDLILSAVSQLKPDYQEIIISLFGLSPEVGPQTAIELANQKGTSPANISRKKLNALDHLREILKKEFPDISNDKNTGIKRIRI